MTNPAGLLLLHQILENPVFFVQIRVDIHLADVVEQIEIEIPHLTFFQLFFKDLAHFSHIGQIVSREFVRQIKRFPGISLQRPSHHQLGLAVVVSPGGVEIVDSMGDSVVHHPLRRRFIDPGIVSVDNGQAHGPHSQGGQF